MEGEAGERGRKPTFLGIGAQKCASTWIYRILERHPQIRVSANKELDFFSCHFDRGYGWYESQFSGAGARQVASGEVSPSYFYNPLAVERAKAYNRDFRVLVSLRDPIERMFSNHLHEVRKGHIANADLSFESALVRNPMYLHQSLYARHLKMWVEAFGAANVCVFLQEEIGNDPKGEASRLCAFLGVDDIDDSEFFERRANENVVYKNRTIEMVYSGLGRAARGLGFGRAVRWAKKTDGISAIWSAAKENVRDRVPPMQRETIAGLRAELEPEMRALASMLGVPSLPWPSWRAIVEKAA